MREHGRGKRGRHESGIRKVCAVHVNSGMQTVSGVPGRRVAIAVALGGGPQGALRGYPWAVPVAVAMVVVMERAVVVALVMAMVGGCSR